MTLSKTVRLKILRVFAFCKAHLEVCIKSWRHVKDCIETYPELSGLLILFKIGQVISAYPIWP
jgi:hypothetical protein